jgi:hypothetical protein
MKLQEQMRQKIKLQGKKLSQIAKGKNGMATNKPEFIRKQVESWSEESTIIWCHYNDEQSQMERTFPDAVSVHGGDYL